MSSPELTRSDRASDGRRRRAKIAVPLLGLAALYVLVIALGDARAWSGSDAGGKVATVRWMVEHHSWRPEVGYWAARADPDGVHHQLIYTQLHGGRWVQVTGLPYVYAGALLWHLGGVRALLVLPVLGSLLAAYAARRLALVLGSSHGWVAFWVVGVASPMLFYAGDFWEHSGAVGLALLALALALEHRGLPGLVAAGLAAGTAVVLRTEVGLYLATCGGALLCVSGERRWWLGRPARPLAVLGGGLLPLVGNAAAERAVLGGALRAARAAEITSSAGVQLGARLHDGVLTSIGLFADTRASAFLLGGAAVAGLVALGWLAIGRGRRSPFAVASALIGVVLVAARLSEGPGFIPGAFPASPVSGVGVADARDARSRALLVSALGTLPLVWMVQWRGQLLPQWGGRYVLLTGALTAVIGAVSLERTGLRNAAAAGMLAVAVAIAGFGAVWHVQRTRAFAGAAAGIERAPDDVVIVSTIAHLGREAGAFYGRHRWLSANGTRGFDDAVRVARAMKVRRLDVVRLDGSGSRRLPAVTGYRHVGDRIVPLLDFRLVVSRYVAGP